MKIRKIFIVWLAFTCLLNAQVDSTASGNTAFAGSALETEVDPVIVTATRIPKPKLLAPYAIDQIELNEKDAARPGLSMAGVLNRVPGIWVSDRSNISQGDRISIRGMGARSSFGVRGVKILLDGIPLSLPDGQAQLNNIDLSSVAKIEVLRGGCSSLYGNAAGGVIQLESIGARPEPLYVESGYTFGPNHFRQWRGTLSANAAPFSIAAHFKQLDYDGFREHSASRATQLNINGQFTLSSRLKVKILSHFYDAPYLLNPSSLDKPTAENDPRAARSFVIQQAAGKRLQQWQGGLSAMYSAANGTGVNLSVYHVVRDLLNPIPGQVIDLKRSVNGLRLVTAKPVNAGRSQFVLMSGVDIERQTDQRKEFDNSGIPAALLSNTNNGEFLDRVQRGDINIHQQEQVTGLGLFSELEWRYRSTSVTAGLRWDNYRFETTNRLPDAAAKFNKLAHDQLTPMLGFSFAGFPGAVLYGNFTTAFQTPTTTELGNTVDQSGFNQNLRPEITRQYEIGVKGVDRRQNLDYQVSVYHIRFSNLLIPFQQLDQGSEVIYYRNAGEARNLGLETAVTWQANRALSVSFAHTLMNLEFGNYGTVNEITGEIVQHAGKKVPGVPANRVFGGAIIDIGKGFSGILNAHWTARYFANDDNGPPPGSNAPESHFVNDAYLEVHVSLSKKMALGPASLQMDVGIDNLFDRRYNGSVVPNVAGNRFFEPAPDRQFYGTIKISL